MLRIRVNAEYADMEDPSVNERERTKAGLEPEGNGSGVCSCVTDGETSLLVMRIAEMLGAAEGVAAIESFVSALGWAILDSMNLSFDDVEKEIVERRGPEILRGVLQAHVNRRGTGDVGRAIRLVHAGAADGNGEEGAGGTTVLSHRRERERRIVTTVGPIEVNRQMYGQRGEDSVAPLDEELNLPGRSFSYLLGRKIVTQAARAPYGETALTLEEMTGQHVSVASMLALVEEAAVDFDAFYGQRRVEPGTCKLLVATIDGKGVPIRREVDGKAKRKRRRKGEKANRKKMACVAVVYEVDPHRRTVDEILEGSGGVRGPRLVRTERPRPVNKRAWASLTDGVEGVFESVLAEMRRRDPEHCKTWVCVTDGDPQLDRLAREVLGADGPITVVRDVFHVTEYLWTAAHAFHDEGSDEAEQFVTYYLGELLNGRVSQVVRGMRQSATKLGISGRERKPIDDATRYFMNNRHAMRYDEYLAAGLPIGSGVVEGACRHLVKDRMERSGMRWTIAGAEAVLRMRAIEICGDTEEYWRFHLAREHERRYGSRPWEPVAEAA